MYICVSYLTYFRYEITVLFVLIYIKKQDIFNYFIAFFSIFNWKTIFNNLHYVNILKTHAVTKSIKFESLQKMSKESNYAKV